MIRIVGIVAVLMALYLLLRYFRGLDAPGQKKFWFWFLFSILFAGIVMLTVTGRLHVIAAVVAALLPFAKKLLPVLRYIPVLRRLYKERKADKVGNEGASANSSPKSSGLSRDEAYQVLGLAAGATKEDIVDAHRKLIQKLHPDRGGNDYLAARINEAKDLLLEDDAH
jgi:hypothetical protein